MAREIPDFDDTLFVDGLPPLIGNLVRGRGIEWQSVEPNERLIGRILILHLVLEH